MIAITTDSASMLPGGWRDRDSILVTPMTVVVDGEPYREGVDLGTAEFYRRMADGAEVSTSAPSPGQLRETYQTALDAGATALVAVHTGSAYSAVLNAARVAARQLPIEVHLVDSGTASFPVALCVSAAARARTSGGRAEEVAEAARCTATHVDSVFVVGVPALARRSGRLGPNVTSPEATTVLGLGPGGLTELGEATDTDDAIQRMAEHVRRAAEGHLLRVGVGDAARPDLGARLAGALTDTEGIVELIRYEVGPSVGAHSGPGTVGAVWSPA